ncbi:MULTISPECIES: helix-turn-helix domain-containing protein [Halobacterium]|uniref:winged helix-turn-helix domain-containing protein n=1 Tax=Halobacterium TaxID=2239 RepID=UPI00073E921F|nr:MULTISPECIES: helix-turn-helix domain-containing protein [Halobacterium]MCG1003491.1 helix-turn-helix domain-containing protein [Halobacterium noricense]
MQTNVDQTDADARLRGPFEAAEETDPAAALDALTDPLCRRVLCCARDPITASEVADATDLSLSSTYRKLHTLSDVGLLETQTELRDDGYHTTRYRATLEEATIRIDDDNELHVSLDRSRDGE